MREAASRGFWVTTYAPYGYRKVYVQDGVKKRPKLELSPPADAVVRRVFDMVLQGRSILDVTKTLNAEGIPTTNGKKWLKTTIHTMLDHEAYTGTLVWGANARDGAPPVRVEDAHPTIVSKRDFQRTRRLLASRAPKKMNPRRASSPYLGGVETRAFGSFIRVCCIPGLVASIRLLVEESRLILIHHDVAGWLALGVGWLGKLLLREQVRGKYHGQQLRSFGLKVEGCLDHPQ